LAERAAPAAAAVASAVPTAPAPTPVEGELVSPTLAELYFNQGFPEKAIEVYRRMLEREPGNERARARVAELQDLLAAPVTADPAAVAGEPPAGHRPSADEQARAARRQALERTIERLESLRAALQKGSG
jgi:pentatricopeptide repeat protein